MAITKQARNRNVVDKSPADLNEDQASRFEGGGSDDLDLAQAVRVLMEKQRIADETQRQMRENQRHLETQLKMAKLENEILKSKTQEWGKMAEKPSMSKRHYLNREDERQQMLGE